VDMRNPPVIRDVGGGLGVMPRDPSDYDVSGIY
jgi:hypothetical protein